MTEYFEDVGKPLPGGLPDGFKVRAARETWRAVLDSANFKFIDARCLEDQLGYAELVIVDCSCDRIPSKNAPGFEYPERLALVFFEKAHLLPETRALRIGFPVTPHQNLVPPGAPASICLYFEPWSVVVRNWTPQKHLRRILWWLEESSLERLHRSDQPVEQLYFNAQNELVLPHDFSDKVKDPAFRLGLAFRPERKGQRQTIIGCMRPAGELNTPQNADTSCIALELGPVVHGGIERFPSNLGELADSLRDRGAPFIDLLFENIRQRFKDGVNEGNNPYTILVLSVPLVRERGGVVESISTKAYFLPERIGDLGLKAGILDKHKNLLFPRINIDGTPIVLSEAWRSVLLEPLDVLRAFTPDYARRASGIASPGPKGVLAGVGALGSKIFDAWNRSGWGTWTLIDPDHIKPHNLARHISYESMVGSYKVNVVKRLGEALFGEVPVVVNAIPESAASFDLEVVDKALRDADLVVDVTTTVEYPREHAARDFLPRGISTFLTPSGNGAVLMGEDSERKCRLDAIEAQYYRAVLNQEWGKSHLDGNMGHFWSGAGCRDLSAVIAVDVVAVHAGVLSQQIRQAAAKAASILRVWHHDTGLGTVQMNEIPLEEVLSQDLEEIRVVWDSGLRTKVRGLREQALPAETGGVLLGYFDLSVRKAFVVDVLGAPPDSKGDASGFLRGTKGLDISVEEVRRRTGNMVGYIGEWHSHPKGASAAASGADIIQLVHLARELHNDGLPALMLIVGEAEERWHYGAIREP